MAEKKRVAIVLFNLGGPDGPEAVKPFLFNLFSDPAIIQLPQPLRWLVAKLISSRRAPVAREIYAQIGGGSPIVPETEQQARALEVDLADVGDVRVFIAMRYWHPMAAETALAVKAFEPDEIILLPLYPQYSTTTSGSSLNDWRRAWNAAVGLSPTSEKTPRIREICCYPEANGFIEAVVDLVCEGLEAAGDLSATRLLFSAHGLPKKIVDGGDPYQRQVERTCSAVVKALGLPDRQLDWSVCYQSRVGPLEWIGPSTDAEIERAGRDGKKVVLVPIAFVSEHSETLVELDIEYRELAEKAGVSTYIRVPTVGTGSKFIHALGDLVRDGLSSEDMICAEELMGGTCPGNRAA
ncbi:MAG: ferrochelatase [Parvibaculum sp.]